MADPPSSSEKPQESSFYVLQDLPSSHVSEASTLRRAALAKQLGVDAITERARFGGPLDPEGKSAYPLAKRDASKRLWRAASSGEVQVESDAADRHIAGA